MTPDPMTLLSLISLCCPARPILRFERIGRLVSGGGAFGFADSDRKRGGRPYAAYGSAGELHRVKRSVAAQAGAAGKYSDRFCLWSFCARWLFDLSDRDLTLAGAHRPQDRLALAAITAAHCRQL
jgi:hypothetical protein